MLNVFTNETIKVTLYCLLVFTNAASFAHNKVVVIPLLSDVEKPEFAPLKPDDMGEILRDYNVFIHTVVDLITGLEWQRNATDQIDDIDEMDWEDAKRYCGVLTLNGHSDWRLPTIKELILLGDYTRQAPALNITAFPNVDYSNEHYWSATFDPYLNQDLVELVRTWDAQHGEVVNHPVWRNNYVRCVRGGNSDFSRFVDANDGTVKDVHYGLMWEKANFQNNGSSLEAAISYCGGLVLGGFNDWRVPRVKELVTLLQVNHMDVTEMHPVFEYDSDWVDREQLITTTKNFTDSKQVWAVRFNHFGNDNGAVLYSIDDEGSSFRTDVKCVRNMD